MEYNIKLFNQETSHLVNSLYHEITLKIYQDNDTVTITQRIVEFPNGIRESIDVSKFNGEWNIVIHEFDPDYTKAIQILRDYKIQNEIYW